jgi:hypothetical protein
MFRPADLERSLKSARKAEFEPCAAELRPDGSIKLEFSPLSEADETAFDRWKATHHAR